MLYGWRKHDVDEGRTGGISSPWNEKKYTSV